MQWQATINSVIVLLPTNSPIYLGPPSTSPLCKSSRGGLRPQQCGKIASFTYASPSLTPLISPLAQVNEHNNEHVPCRQLAGGCDLPPKFLPGTTTHCDPHNIVSLEKEAGESVASYHHRLALARNHALQMSWPERQGNYTIAKALQRQDDEPMPAAYGPAIYSQSADIFNSMMQAAEKWPSGVRLILR